MKKNEIRAWMDIYKLGMQAFIAFYFAMLLKVYSEGKITSELAIFPLLMLLIIIITRKYLYLARELDKIEG